MAQMPAYELYLKNKQKVLNSKHVLNEYMFMRVEPLLTKDQEYHLFRQYNYLKYKVVNLKPSKQPDPEYLAKIKEIRDIIVCANARLVVVVLKRQKYKDFENAMSDGYYGLIDAVDLFDYRKGFKFATYAYWAIQSKIQHYSQIELKERSKTTQEDFLDTYPCKETDEISQNEDRLIFQEKLKCVSERERKVISYYYGLNNEARLGLKEISQKLKISRERVRQIRVEGLKKILGRGFSEKEKLALCS